MAAGHPRDAGLRTRDRSRSAVSLQASTERQGEVASPFIGVRPGPDIGPGHRADESPCR